jgi:hypothetical protein
MVLNILSRIFHLAKLKLCPCKALTPNLWATPTPGKLCSTFCSCELDYSKYLTEVRLYNACFCFLLLHSIMYSKFIHRVACDRISFLSVLRMTLLNAQITFWFHQSSSGGHWLASTFWLLWTVLLWTHGCKYLFMVLLSYTQMWNCGTAGLHSDYCLIFKEPLHSSVAAAPLHSSTDYGSAYFHFSTSWPTLVASCSFGYHPLPL